MSDFVLRHGLWTGAQEEAAADIAECIAKLGTVRFAFSDAHGVVRGKTLIAADAIGALRTGVTCTLTMLLKDLSGRTAFPVFQRGATAPAIWSWSPIPPRSESCRGRRTVVGSCATSTERTAHRIPSPRAR